ncbi:MAG: DUF1704 domain-containing protein, partial [Candidatus Diapherotrites archaeon]|nr:DUF1704 domain-containing protein [Candidatus Diapherotrites archaeon]
EIKQDFLEIEQKLFSITEELETDFLKFINPSNAVSERKRFFQEQAKRQEYNPRFVYLPKNPVFSHFSLNPEFARIMKQLNEIQLDEIGLGKLIGKKRIDLIKKMEFIRSIGSKTFTEKAIEFFGKPETKLVKKAEEVMELEKGNELQNIRDWDCMEELHQALLNRNIYDWRIVVDENLASNASVQTFQKIMKIRQGSFHSQQGIQRLIVHEIETHIYRYLNGAAQKYKIFTNGTDRNWQLTEEGLAVYNEQVFAVHNNDNLRDYAGRVLGIEYGLKHSFYETFLFLKNFFEDDKAYQITQRVKRGMHDTQEKGAFTKDYFYLQGLETVKEFVEKGNNPKMLYYGKISVEDIEHLKEIPEIIEPKFVPDYSKLKN